MALMSFPLLLLYGASIFLVRIVERMRAKDQPSPA
jgi:Sec-independent protein secretion pathway component TatC